MVQKMGGKTVEMFSDSKLVIGQVKKELEAGDAIMQEYLGQVRRYKKNLNSLTYRISLEVEIPMQILWLPLPLPRHRIYLE